VKRGGVEDRQERVRADPQDDADARKDGDVPFANIALPEQGRWDPILPRLSPLQTPHVVYIPPLEVERFVAALFLELVELGLKDGLGVEGAEVAEEAVLLEG
jgi:hypothetical protein